MCIAFYTPFFYIPRSVWTQGLWVFWLVEDPSMHPSKNLGIFKNKGREKAPNLEQCLYDLAS